MRKQLTCLATLAAHLRGISNKSANEFDYVVVGGGTAGATVATRLAEKSFTVALIEAGTYYENSSMASIPLADVFPVGSDPRSRSDIDWGFVARGQPGANFRDIHFARGKCLGGSSALNFMIYQRPTKESLQQWADVVNDSSYTFDQVLPYFKKSVQFAPGDSSKRYENATVKYDAAAFDPKGGPLQVTYANHGMTFSTWMKLGLEAVGIKETADFNSGSLLGAQYCSSTIRPDDQSRSSLESSFLAAKPKALQLYTRTLAKKVLFDKNKRAIGVEVTDAKGVTSQIMSSREVILSAGAFQSPQLLMVSGIGPAAVLNQFEIPVISDLPGVGQNMWDHPFFAVSHKVDFPTLTQVANDFEVLAQKLDEYTSNHTGLLTSPVADFLGWEKIPNDLRANFTADTKQALAALSADWPEAEYISGAGYIGNASNLMQQPQDGAQYASILGVLIAPTSRGNVTIKSADVSDLPIINPNWLATETDRQVAVAIFRRLRETFNSKPMASVILGNEYYPGLNVQTDDQILEFIKNNIMTLWHPAGTCKMGSSDDPMAVVDSQARVRNISGLRVVDASAFPFLPPGHPQSTVCK
ncbi:hypothetical protein QQS21_003256 [Conoideocrella luteorostrata]|uniref:Glucose-methanol-choline oxidoreductase N-terminal domain-containing protein n=1 Tax=Conoideocrella luteorostrata TaxID=1105319 RepID=A0AAJ0CWF8_9HYPO|nr:hypothetical protein QQS21_003256 [Conoideocrella luteorostrata]